LLLLRLTGLVWIAPLFSARVVPNRVKAALLALLCLLLWPFALASADRLAAPAQLNAATALAELTVGLTLGLGAGLFVAAAESAGDIAAVQIGLSAANLFDPMSETQMPVIGQFLGLFATAIVLSSGGHAFLLGSLHRSLEVLPAGGTLDFSAGVGEVVQLGGTLLALGLRFAAPVVAAILLCNIALGVLARAVPQLNVLMAAFPLQIAVGLFVLAASLPLLALTLAGWPEAYDALSARLLERLAPGGSR
jgi:flagellar biosynthetic protein FliR